MSRRAEALLDWYETNQRDFPWRRTDDPYLILVSEVMLQQTQAERVVPFFERFVEQYPSVEDLAVAPLPEVLSIWKGLGYPSRARRLREAARIITGHGWPEDLTALPGVGAYTAAAVGSFAFDRDEVAVDTNVKRVVSRWWGTPLSGRALAEAAAEVKDAPASTWNQAVMELGATVCRPKTPRCDACPVEAWCADPNVYSPPPRQASYEGSKREARGKVLSALLATGAGTVGLPHLTECSGVEASTLPGIIEDLERDGLVTTSQTGVALAP